MDVFKKQCRVLMAFLMLVFFISQFLEVGSVTTVGETTSTKSPSAVESTIEDTVTQTADIGSLTNTGDISTLETTAEDTGTPGTTAEDTGATGKPAEDTGATGTPAEDTGATGKPAENTGATGTPAEDTGAAGRTAEDTGATGTPAEDTGAAGTTAEDTGAAGTTAGYTGAAGTTAEDTGAAGTTAGDTGTAGTTAGDTGTAGSTAGDTGTAGTTAGDTGAAGRTAEDTGATGTTAEDTGAAGRTAEDTGAAGRTAGDTGTAGSTAGDTGTAGTTAGDTGTAGSTAGDTGTAGTTAGDTGTAGTTAGDTGTAGTTAGDTGTAGTTAGDTGTAGTTAEDTGKPETTAEDTTSQKMTTDATTKPEISTEAANTPEITTTAATIPEITTTAATTPEITTTAATTPEITTTAATTPEITTTAATTPEITTTAATTPEITTTAATTPEITTTAAITPDITTTAATTPEITTTAATTPEITTTAATTPEITTTAATTPEITTTAATTPEITTTAATTPEITDDTGTPELPAEDTDTPETSTEDTTSQKITTDTNTTPEITTEVTTTPEITTEATTTPEITTEATTTPEITTEATTTPEITTEATTTLEITTEATTTPEITTEATTTPEITTEATTTPEITTEATTTPEITTEATTTPEITTEATTTPEITTEATTTPEITTEVTTTPEITTEVTTTPEITTEATTTPEITTEATTTPEITTEATTTPEITTEATTTPEITTEATTTPEITTEATTTPEITTDATTSPPATTTLLDSTRAPDTTATRKPTATSGFGTELFPFGEINGDYWIPIQYTLSSIPIVFSTGLPFGSILHTFCQVASNGAIYFGGISYTQAYNPDLQQASNNKHHILAPFWANIDPFFVDGRVFFHLYERFYNWGTYFYSHRQEEVFARATNMVRQFGRTPESRTFVATTVLVVTYVNMRPFAWYTYYCYFYYSYCFDSVESNTFQSMYITDGETAYAITIYKYGAMTWKYVQGRRIALGFAIPGYVKDYGLTYTTLTTTLDKDVGSAGIIGVYFDVVGQGSNPAQKCADFYVRNKILVDTAAFQKHKEALCRCPCTRDRLGAKWWFAGTRGKNNEFDCYALSPVYISQRNPGNPLNKLCCYRLPPLQAFYSPYWPGYWQGYDSWSYWRQYSYASSCPYAGHILTANPFAEWLGSTESLTQDFNPYKWCCLESNWPTCQKFYEVRQDNGCLYTADGDTGTTWGDPHITTLDGHRYTLNVWGEYIMVEIKKISFVLQARTDRAENKDGAATNATVFVAFAARVGTSATLQVELSRKKTSMVIYADGADLTREFYASEKYKKPLKNFTVARENRNETQFLIVLFPEGVSLRVSVAIRSLEVTLEVEKTLRGQLTGLLGNFNGDMSDDFILPSGTVLTTNQTDTQRKIFENFGRQWEVTDNSSIFMYPEGESHANYSHPDFVPTFLEDFSAAELEAARSKCASPDSSANAACIFDLLTTRDESFANKTRSSALESSAVKEALKNTLPRLKELNGLNIANLWEVTEGKLATISVQAIDDDGDTVRYVLINGTDKGLSISDEGVLSYIADTSRPVQIMVLASDSKGGMSNTEVIAVAVCPNCSGRGNCDRSRQRSFDETFFVYACDCSTGYTGANCEQQRNECNDHPCLAGQTCVDLDPSVPTNSSTIGYTCGDCPVGFHNQRDRCFDINECNNRNLCSQNCTNTEGSYFCHCGPGYRLNPHDKHGCLDINECDELTSGCQQVCNNTVGGYICTCLEGYILHSNGSCGQDPRYSEICRQLDCPQLCQVTNGKASCKCYGGYTLGQDSTACVDMDECRADQRICSHECNNTEGGFQCSCFPGYKLDKDGVSCLSCPKGYYGHNCSQVCRCNGQGRCDPGRGCICYSGWEGVTCNTDVDECTRKLDNCSSRQVCQNTLGGFSCVCQKGFETTSNGSCKDIDECRTATHSCKGQNEICMNTNGSFVCRCQTGYTRGSNNTCRDVDECVTGSDKCQQMCLNVPATFTCGCFSGYTLDEDRLSCVKVKDECKGVSNLSCDHGCSVNSKTNTATCFCNRGFVLDGKEKCKDVDECASSSTNQCGGNSVCKNHEGGYTCLCNEGFRLDNDQRTCIGCEKNATWGSNCTNNCSCSAGASDCSTTKGCVCLPGYTGRYCDEDVNQCDKEEVKCDSLKQEVCVNRQGPDSCVCLPGYQRSNLSGPCEDVDECADRLLSPCPQNCHNFPGGFNCSCFPGFNYNTTTTNTCSDIDECTLNLDRCEQTQTCVNTHGTYYCSLPGHTQTPTVASYQFVVVFSTNTSDVDNIVKNTSSNGYKLLKDYLEQMMKSKLDPSVPGMKRVTVVKMTKGSLLVLYNALIDSAKNDNPAGTLVFELSKLYNVHFEKYGRQLIIRNITTVNGTLVVQQNLCPAFDAIYECPAGKRCHHTANSPPVCGAVLGGASNDKLILGLAVGLSLFVLLCVVAVVVLLVLIYKKRRYSPSVSDDMAPVARQSSIFTKPAGMRKSWNLNNYANDSFCSDKMSVDSSEADCKPKLKHVGDSFHEPVFAPDVAEGKENSSFSWDFVLKSMKQEDDFKIQRPRIVQSYSSKM